MNYIQIFLSESGIHLRDQSGNQAQVSNQNWDDFINQSHLFQTCQSILQANGSTDSTPFKALAPIENQEIWAAGVTYLRSKVARMEESKESGGDTFYDKVYSAERPEIFYKGNKIRSVGPGGQVRIRKDSQWNVPEPELTLFINSAGELAGYSIGNDMSSRDIEGENPLYLPQAKVYDGAAGLGPCLLVTEKPLDPSTEIAIWIKREGQQVFEGSTHISQMKRSHQELVDYLTMELSFPAGAYLMTGTCIVPDPPFTLQADDHIYIQIEPIGILENIVQ